MMYPGLTSWAKFSRPCGTKLANPGPHTPSCNCSRRGATQEYRRVCSTSARLRIVSDTHWCRMRQVRGEATLQPVPFEDGRSVVSRVACRPSARPFLFTSSGWMLLPCGYVMSAHGALVAGIPGLKSETWGTLRAFPTRCVQAIMYGVRTREWS
jgi:hypothetical protein